MKKFSKVLVFVLAFISFATLESEAQKKQPKTAAGTEVSEEEQGSEDTKVIKERVRIELEKSMVSFVNAVRPAYVNGMTSESFKVSLAGKSNAQSMSKEGSNLLSKAFELVANNSSDEEIKKQGLKAIAAVAKYTFDYNKANNLGAKSVESSVALFGGNVDELNQTQATSELSKTQTNEKRACKWYQVGCHLQNLADWIEEHPKTAGFIRDIICFFAGC